MELGIPRALIRFGSALWNADEITHGFETGSHLHPGLPAQYTLFIPKYTQRLNTPDRATTGK